MVGSPQAETTLRDVYRALFRHRRKAAWFFVVVMTTVTLATIFWPKAYRSEGALYIRMGRENVTLDSAATIGRESVVAITDSRENEINSVVEVLGSQALAEAVVDAVGPAAVLELDRQSASAESTAGLLARAAGVLEHAEGLAWRCLEQIGLVTPLGERDRAIRRLLDRLEVSPVRKSNVIRIAYDSRCPELSQAVVSKLIDEFVKRHVRLNRTEGAYEFLSEQADRSRREVVELEQELRNLKTETGLASPDDQRRIIVERIGLLEDDLARTTSETAAAEARIGRLRDLLASLPETELASETTGIGDDGTDGMRQQYYALEIRAKELEAKCTESHPLLREVRKQVAAAAEVLSREEPTRRQVTTATGKPYEQVRLELLREEPLLWSLRATGDTVRSQLAEVRGQLKTLNENELQIARLQREVDLGDAKYRKYATNLEQSRIDQAVESERISNVSIAQEATCNVKPVRPRKVVNLFLGLLVGVFGGLGLALLSEYLDHSFGTPEQIEEKLELPALVSIPRLNPRQLAVNGRN